MPRLALASLAAAALGLALVPLSGASTSAVADEGTVTMSGTAYQFNTVHTLLAPAIVAALAWWLQMPLLVAGLDDIIRSKKAAGRPRDASARITLTAPATAENLLRALGTLE